MVNITDHAVKLFASSYLGLDANQFRMQPDYYSEDLIYHYLSESKEIEVPLYVQVEKRLKYDHAPDAKYLYHVAEQLLFIQVGKNIVTCYCPYLYTPPKKSISRRHKLRKKKRR